MLSTELFAEWRGRSLTFLAGFLGSDHTYTRSFEKAVEEVYHSSVEWGIGILRGLRADVAAGYVTSVRELIHADVFTDFLDMADHLLAEGYKDPAAVLTSGVLEEHLRQLCQKHSVDTEVQTPAGLKPKKAEVMNQDLAKAGAYSVTDQKQVTAWLDLRNKAAHAKYAEYTKDEVALFRQGVLGYMARNPA